MERYDYFESVTADVKKAILENIDNWEYSDRDELEEVAYDALFCDDTVTGNASGSYYCSTYKAEEALCHNWDILADAIDEFGGDVDVLRQGAEACDVTIRCYLLGQAISAALEDFYNEKNSILQSINMGRFGKTWSTRAKI